MFITSVQVVSHKEFDGRLLFVTVNYANKGLLSNSFFSFNLFRKKSVIRKIAVFHGAIKIQISGSKF